MSFRVPAGGMEAGRAIRIVPLLCAMLLFGCTARRGAHPVAGPIPGPLPSAESLLRIIEHHRTSVTGLRTLAHLRYENAGRSRNARQLLLVARPDRLRWEILSPFGSAFVLTVAAGRLAAYTPGERVLYRGPASPATLEHFSRVALPVRTIVDLLLGVPPLDRVPNAVVSRDGDRIKLWTLHDGRVNVAWFDAKLHPVLYEEQGLDGRVHVRARFEPGADSVPAGITIELPLSHLKLRLDYHDVEINPSLPDALFHLSVPAGIRVVPLEPEP